MEEVVSELDGYEFHVDLLHYTWRRMVGRRTLRASLGPFIILRNLLLILQIASLANGELENFCSVQTVLSSSSRLSDEDK